MTDITEKARRGLPLDDVLIIDCHCHMGYWQHFNVPEGNAEGMLRSMDSLGTDRACITAHASIGPDYIYGNTMVLNTVKHYPERFWGYVTINPNYEEDIEDELSRCLAVDGIIGIKIHPSCHGCQIDYKNYQPVYEIANSNKYPILIHVWGNSAVKTVDKLAGQYPNAIFIMGHGGADIDAMFTAIEVVNKRDNVYVDLAISKVREGNVEWLVKEMGSSKILYGTDMPFFDPRPAFGRLAFAEISDEEKKNIFGLNMDSLLNVRW